MKYYQTSKFPKFVGGAGFYSIIAICLIAIGAISWFAVSRYNTVKENPTPQSSVDSAPTNPPAEEKPQVIPDEEPIEGDSVQTENSAEQVPYDEEKEKPQETASVFTMPLIGNILKGYSETALQHSATYGDMRLHTGIDIASPLGTDIKSAAKGTVTETEEDTVLGKCITIDHGNGIMVKYCGFNSFSVSDGEEVSAGTVLGTLGTVPSECADESHLHIEVKKNGKTVSPLTILGEKK